MGRPSNTEERRGQIARAMLAVVAERGIDGASVARVAAEAGVAAGLVHYHFRDKHELLLAALGELTQRHEARLAESLAGAGEGAVAQLDAFLEAHLGLAGADPEALACWVAVSGEALRDRTVQGAFAGAVGRLVERLVAIAERGQREGVLASADVRAAAVAVMATIEGYIVLAAATPELIPRGTALGSARAMAHGLFGVRPRGEEGERPVRPAGKASRRGESLKGRGGRS